MEADHTVKDLLPSGRTKRATFEATMPGVALFVAFSADTESNITGNTALGDAKLIKH